MRGRRQEMAPRSPAGVEPGPTMGGRVFLFLFSFSRHSRHAASSLPSFQILSYFHTSRSKIFSLKNAPSLVIFMLATVNVNGSFSGSRSRFRIVFPPLFSAESRYVTAPQVHHQVSFRTDPIQDVQRWLQITVLLKG